MNNERQKVKKHISAAKDWLGRAENSMDRDNDVRGDLDMMLAQAELQQAKETRLGYGWRKWLVRLSPILVALLLGIGYMVFLQMASPTPAGSPEQSSSPAPVVDYPESAEATFKPEIADSAEKTEAVPRSYEVAPSQDSSVADNSLDKKDEAPVIPPAMTENIPEADMQKLMQAAGKTLRE